MINFYSRIFLWDYSHWGKQFPLLSFQKPCSLSKAKDSFGHKPFKSASLKVINFYGRIFLRDYSHWGKWFPPWSWSCDITWHNRLIFFFLLLTHVLPIYFHHFLYKVFIIIVIIILIGDYLFTLSKGKSTFFYYYYHVYLPWLIRSSSACHGHMNEVLGKRGIICAQAGLKWVAVWPVSTPLLRILGPSIVGGSPTQHYKKAHHKKQIWRNKNHYFLTKLIYPEYFEKVKPKYLEW